MKIAIAGAGAMGSVYGHMLAQAGNDVVFLDPWQEHVNNINNNGLIVDEVGVTKVTHVKAYQPKEFNDKVDLVIIFTKSLTLEKMLEDIKDIIDENTRALCLLNGLGHAKTVSKYIDPKNILMGVTLLTASLKAPGSVGFSSYGKTEIQNLRPESESIAHEVVETLNKSGLPAEYSKDIFFSIWRKACVNGACNSICTILDSNMLQMGTVPKISHLVYKVLDEFSLIAKTEGVELDTETMTNMVCALLTPEFKGACHYPSMHQDLIKNHRLTEIDYLNGYIARRGEELNIPTPYNDLINLLVHGKEKIMNVK